MTNVPYRKAISTPDAFVIPAESRTTKIVLTTATRTVELVGPGNMIRVALKVATLAAIPTVLFEFGVSGVTTSSTLPNNVNVISGMAPVGYFKRQPGVTHVAAILVATASGSEINFTPCFLNES